MTDGLIQNVIEQFVYSLGYNEPKKQIMFMKLQDKLIAEINKNLIMYTDPMVSIVVRQQLIGDNQE